MAFMSTEHAREIRNSLKESFPGYKFSVKKHHHSSIDVTLLKSPLDFSKDMEKQETVGYCSINHYYLNQYSNADVLKKMYEVINKGNYNKSDIMVDHFDVGFYVHMNIGDWEKHYICTK